MTIALRYAASTDVGLVRANNQDSAYAGPHLLALADGMGGHAGGDVASSIAVANLAPLDAEAHGPDSALSELDRALHAAQAALVTRAKDDADLAGMGTTVTALLLAENKLVMAHIGDSRGYLLRDGDVAQVTTDHTFVQYLVSTGRISEAEAEIHPQRSVVMRVLGDHDVEIVPDLSVREARPGDRWLLCSDGLSDIVSLETIGETLAEHEDVGECADALVQLALRGGGHDNVTVVVADVVELDDLPDGAGPSAASVVVGSAADAKTPPTSAADSPAAKAAALTPPPEADDDAMEMVEEVPAPERKWLRRTWRIGAAVVVVVAFVLGYTWTQTQYFVGVYDQQVAIFRGIPQSIGPVTFYTVLETTGQDVTELSALVQDRLDQAIPRSSLDDARTLAAELVPAPTSPPGDASSS